MGWQVRRERIRYDTDDTGAPFGFVYASLPVDDEEYEDAFDFIVPPESTWPDWRCEECNQRWPGDRTSCGYCGYARSDIDGCG